MVEKKITFKSVKKLESMLDQINDKDRTHAIIRIHRNDPMRLNLNLDSLDKAEKIIKVKATHKKKAHKRKIHFEGKEKANVKSSLHPDNLEKIEGIYDQLKPITGGIHEDETFICEFKDGSSAIHKVMEPGDIIGEVGAYETSKIIGWDIVPETIQCDYGKGKGSSQKWIDGKEPMSEFGGSELKEEHFDSLSKIFIIDMILGNFDRHDGNLIIKDNKVYGIDNEMIGKLNNAKLHLDELKTFSKYGYGAVPMLRVLNNNIGNDSKMWQSFKDHVDKNISEVLKNKNEIIKYWNGYKGLKDTKFMGSIPSDEGIEYIKRNLKDLEKYNGENK